MRVQVLKEAAAVARRMASVSREETEGTHSSHHNDLRRAWADAAERVAETLTALTGQGSSKRS